MDHCLLLVDLRRVWSVLVIKKNCYYILDFIQMFKRILTAVIMIPSGLQYVKDAPVVITSFIFSEIKF